MPYPFLSEFKVTTLNQYNQTILKDVYTTQPYRLFNPFPWKKQGLKIYQMSSSPGTLDGDQQKFQFNIQDQTQLWLTSQSYDKMFTCETKRGATREIEINVASNAYFRYTPLPMIPFRNSIFNSKINIHLQDQSSRLAFSDMIAAGRIFKKPPEKFEYETYCSQTNLYLQDRLIYLDNLRLHPKQYDLSSIDYFGDKNYLLNLLLVNFSKAKALKDQIRLDLEKVEEIDFGVTEFAKDQLLIRVFAMDGQKLVELCNQIIDRAENMN